MDDAGLLARFFGAALVALAVVVLAFGCGPWLERRVRHATLGERWVVMVTVAVIAVLVVGSHYR